MTVEGALAVKDALERPTGAIDNGPTLRRPRAARKQLVQRHASPVVIVREPIRGWTCDSCPKTGSGLPSLLGHTATRGHRVFTKVS